MNELHTNHEQSTAHKPALHPKESQKGAKDCETYQEMGTESLGESEAVSRALTQFIDFSDKGVFMRGCELYYGATWYAITHEREEIIFRWKQVAVLYHHLYGAADAMNDLAIPDGFLRMALKTNELNVEKWERTARELLTKSLVRRIDPRFPKKTYGLTPKQRRLVTKPREPKGARLAELLDNNPDVLMQVRGTKVVHTVLREARVAVSLTISSAAELAGIAHSAVSRWENGHRISHPKYIAALAIVYGVHPSILQNGAET